VGEKRAGISYAGLAHGREKGRGWWAAADAFRARGMSATDHGNLHFWLLERQSRSLLGDGSVRSRFQIQVRP
jgi:hypothetical protein